VSPGAIWIIEAAVGHSALKGVGRKRIYEEKVSGAKRARPELAGMLDQLRAGDVVVVPRLDRLARSTRNLRETAEQLKEAEAGLRSLLVLTVFAGIAEFERELIHECTRSGRVAATRREACASVAHRS
jgi:DNA invertase Pin-like site-specific DNA recombinase